MIKCHSEQNKLSFGTKLLSCSSTLSSILLGTGDTSFSYKCRTTRLVAPVLNIVISKVWERFKLSSGWQSDYEKGKKWPDEESNNSIHVLRLRNMIPTKSLNTVDALGCSSNIFVKPYII